MRKYLLFLGVLSSSFTYAQDYKSSVEARINLLDKAPYWMRTNQYGSNPIDGPSLSIIGRASKETGTKLLDWGASLDVRADLGKDSRLTLIEGYAKVKAGPLEVRGGRVKEFMGLVDSTLSVGSFSMSGTTLGIPKIEIRVPDYWPKNSLISAKGNFAHGWHGYMPTKGTLAETDSMYTYFHQKSLWVRIARPHWKLRLYGGFVDNAFWGDEYRMHSSFKLSKAQRYWSVISGKNWQDSKVGNHAGNIDLRVEYDVERITMFAYRQFFYEVGALWHLANIADGLLGIGAENKDRNQRTTWHKVLVEVVYTKNQAGETWSKPTPTGNENYLNHYMYNHGWSYRKLGLGLPLVTRRTDAMHDLPYNELEYFVNNRLWGINLGVEGKVFDWQANGKLTYTRNFGTRKTETIFPVQNQFSLLLGTRKQLNNGLSAGAQFAADLGGLLPNSAGLVLSLSKRLL
jgi:hypothetical protein